MFGLVDLQMYQMTGVYHCLITWEHLEFCLLRSSSFSLLNSLLISLLFLFKLLCNGEKKKLKPIVSSFTPNGDFLAILSPDGTVKIWNTSYQSLVAEWKRLDVDSGMSYSCMTCSFVGKKRRKEHGACLLLALVTNDGSILVVDIFAGEMKWESSRYHPGGIVGLSFANKGRILHVVGTNGMVSTLK